MLWIKENVDLKELDKYENKFTCKDSSGYFLYNSLIEPTKILRIWEYSREVEFINGEFPKARKLVNDLIKAGLVEER